MRALAPFWARVCSRSGTAERVVTRSMWESTSWVSKRTRERGVDRSRGRSFALLVRRTRELAKDRGSKDGSVKVS